MDCGISIRTLVVGSDTHVVVLAGVLDEAAAPAVAAALQRGAGHPTIVDLLDVTGVDATGASLLERPNVVLVADQRVLRMLTTETETESRPRAFERLTDALADAAIV